MKITKKLLFALILVMFAASVAAAGVTPVGNLGSMTCDCVSCLNHPLSSLGQDGGLLKTTFEQSHDRITEAQRTGTWNPVWTRMWRTTFADTASQTNLPHGYDLNGEIVPFVMLVAEHSGGRIRYESMTYSPRDGHPMPLLVVAYPRAPKCHEEALTHPDFRDRIRIRIQSNIHGGENDGKEATLLFLRSIAMGKYDDILRDAILLVSPTANPDGLNAQTRGFANGSDPNRNWSHAVQPEIRAGKRLYRLWEPHIVVDYHNIGSSGLLQSRHVITWTNGKQGNNDPRVDWQNTSFAEAAFGGGHSTLNPYHDPHSFYIAWMDRFIERFSPPQDNLTSPISGTGEPVYSLSASTIRNEADTANIRSPQRNWTISHIAQPYMEGVTAGRVIRDIGDSAGPVDRWEAITLPNPGSDSVRSTATVPIAMNKFSILVEIVHIHHPWMRVNSNYASHAGIVDTAVKHRQTLLDFFNYMKAGYENLNNNSPKHLRTVALGAIDYRNSVGSNTGDGGNAAAPFRKIRPMQAFDENWNFVFPVFDTNIGVFGEFAPGSVFDHGYGPGIWKYESFHFGTGGSASANTNIDYNHFPRLILNNIPQWPIKMGAFYFIDARAANARDVLLRHGIPVYRLKEDVTLTQAQRMLGVDGIGRRTPNWGITKHNFLAYNLVHTTKLPRPRPDVIDNFSTTANLISPNFAGVGNFLGTPWVPLTATQAPTLQEAPHFGGGDWFDVTNEINPAGTYVVPTAHRLARFIGFKVEPRSNCGLLFWGHFDCAVSVRPTPVALSNDVTPPPMPWDINNPPAANVRVTEWTGLNGFDLYMVKTFDYGALDLTNAALVEPLVYRQDLNLRPNFTFAPPFTDRILADLPDAGAKVTDATQSDTCGYVTVTIESALLHHGQWLTFFFYDREVIELTAEHGLCAAYWAIPVLAQVRQTAPGVLQAVFTYEELIEEGLIPGYDYAIHYSDGRDTAAGYGTLTVGVLEFSEYTPEPTPTPTPAPDGGSSSCNTGYSLLAFALLGALPLITRRK